MMFLSKNYFFTLTSPLVERYNNFNCLKKPMDSDGGKSWLQNSFLSLAVWCPGWEKASRRRL
jgi:hypothetical protein